MSEVVGRSRACGDFLFGRYLSHQYLFLGLHEHVEFLSLDFISVLILDQQFVRQWLCSNCQASVMSMTE